MSRKQNYFKHYGLLVPILACFALHLSSTESEAAIIASEDFESYPAVVGDPDPHFGGSGENGGAGSWTSAWELGPHVVDEMHVRSGLLPGFGKSLDITNRGNPSDINIITRQFATQTDDIYVGLTMRTTIDAAGLDDHLLFYISDTTGASHNASYGAGTLRGSDVAGNFNTRQGTASSHVDSGITQVYGQTYNVVFKITKSGIATDPFDGIELFVDQATEGTPDAISASGVNSLSDLSTFHIWFDPRGSSPNQGHLALDNLVIATTYSEALSLANTPIVPEPTSLSLLGLALGLCAVGTRKRR